MFHGIKDCSCQLIDKFNANILNKSENPFKSDS